VQDGHALPRAARPPAHDVNGCFFVHYSALHTFPWMSWTPLPCRPQRYCCWLLLCPCTTSWYRGRTDSCILRPFITQMWCLTWERPCHTRNHVGHVVTLLAYVELEVNGYIEHLYRDLKPHSNIPYLVTSTGVNDFSLRLHTLISLRNYLSC